MESRRLSQIRIVSDLTNRMGLVDGIKEPKKVEMALWKNYSTGRKAVNSVTDWCIMEEKSVRREQNRIVKNAA